MTDAASKQEAADDNGEDESKLPVPFYVKAIVFLFIAAILSGPATRAIQIISGN